MDRRGRQNRSVASSARKGRSIRALDSDLTTTARIRDAALKLFAGHGVSGVSIRDVAAAAAVSPGAVQHHFQSKERLRYAVEEFVIGQVVEALGNPIGGGTPSENTARLNSRLSELIRRNPAIFAYVGRSLLQGDAAGMELFERLFRLVRAQADGAANAKLLRRNVDRDWAALHLILIDIGTYLFEPAVRRCLGDSPVGAAGLERMGRATEALFLQGVYRSTDPELGKDPLHPGRGSR